MDSDLQGTQPQTKEMIAPFKSWHSPLKNGGRVVSFRNASFSGSMLNFWGVFFISLTFLFITYDECLPPNNLGILLNPSSHDVIT